MVLRVDTSGDPSFSQILERVRLANLGAYEHQDLPFDRLVEILNPVRSRARHPLFQVMLGLESGAVADGGLELPGLTTDPLLTHSGRAMFDLNINLFERPGDTPALEGGIEYAADLFDHATVESIAARMVRVLEAVADDPGRPISQIEILTPAEREQLLYGWNRTARPVPPGTVRDLLEAVAAGRPDSIAIASDDGTVTYAELNARANQLARLLIRRGAGPEQIVAMLLPRSAELIVALLAVIKSGAAYLAVDLAYPADRIEVMLADADPVCLITTHAQAAAVGCTDRQLLIDDAAAGAELAAQPGGDLTAAEGRGALRPGNPAYLLYTSGSTGKPKAVVVSHGALVNYLTWSVDALHAVSGTTILHTSVSFDFTITTLLSPLAAGGCVRLVPVTADGRTELRGEDIAACTFLKVTPSHLPLIVDLPGDGPLPEQLMLCGEPLNVAAITAWQLKYPGVQVVAGYGPTECTVESSWYEVDPPGRLPDGLVPLGRALPNIRQFVLDERLRPLPAGVTGEVYVTGTGLARGYLRSPALTASRFVACPFGATGELMYRTGDLARWRADGHMVPAGRSDDQVKVRGYRVEPGEIEAALARHPRVSQAVVTARPDASGDTALAAYIVPSGDEQVHTADLRSHLAALLPSYMVPSAFMVLDRLPLNPNKKVDRGALPAPDFTAALSDDSEPRTPREQMLCTLFSDVLGLPRVGIYTSFFDLGGHSLLAARLVFGLRRLLDREIGVGIVFAHPTVEELARALDAGQDAVGSGAMSGSGQTLDDLLAAMGGEEPVAYALASLPAAGPASGPDGEDAHILLTGATGYFGAFLLDELLTTTSAHISCLVRAADPGRGMERIRMNLARYDRWLPTWADRLSVIAGDLEQPSLGLTEPEYAHLAASVTSIYHCAGQVNLLQPFAAVRASNVDGTRHLIRLATTSAIKHLHLISTDAVLGDISAATAGDNGGYVLSKRLAELLVSLAREHGLPASIYRMPRLSLDSRTAMGNPRDFGLQLLNAAVRNGIAPDLNLREMWIPVDEAARLVIATSLRRPDGGRFSVVTDGGAASLLGLVDMVREAGFPIGVKPAGEWVDHLRAAGSEENEVVLTVMGMAGAGQGDLAGAEIVIFEDPESFGELLTGPQVDVSTLGRYLASSAGQTALRG
jgi:amino acid adenylation domain-containing protein/thioester reductase-like protein